MVNHPANEYVVDKKMRILGFRISRFNSGKRRHRKVASKLERLANAALLEDALRNPKALTAIINEYGKIEVNQDDEMAADVESLRAKSYDKAIETLLASRGKKLANLIDVIIDWIMDTGDRSGQQTEEISGAGNITGEPGCKPIVDRWQSGKRSYRHASKVSGLLIDLIELKLLVKLASHGKQIKSGGNDSRKYEVESKGEAVEIDENEYRNYLNQRQGQERIEVRGYPPDMNRQSRLLGTTKPAPAPLEENKG